MARYKKGIGRRVILKNNCQIKENNYKKKIISFFFFLFNVFFSIIKKVTVYEEGYKQI